jgi:hypothetical protein
VTDDVFAWAASLPKEHECVWVEHPTPEESQRAHEKIVRKRLWWWPLGPTQTRGGANVAYAKPYNECAICDKRNVIFSQPHHQNPFTQVTMDTRPTASRAMQELSRRVDHNRVGGSIGPSRLVAAGSDDYTSHTLQEACVFE